MIPKGTLVVGCSHGEPTRWYKLLDDKDNPAIKLPDGRVTEWLCVCDSCNARLEGGTDPYSLLTRQRVTEREIVTGVKAP